MWRVCIYIFLHGATAPNGPGLHDCTHTHHTLPNNTQQSQETDIHAPAGFEPAIPASERPPESACMIFFRYLMPSFLKIDATLSIFLTSGWIMGPTHTHTHTHTKYTFILFETSQTFHPRWHCYCLLQQTSEEYGNTVPYDSVCQPVYLHSCYIN